LAFRLWRGQGPKRKGRGGEGEVGTGPPIG